jgi:hypothetical protein
MSMQIPMPSRQTVRPKVIIAGVSGPLCGLRSSCRQREGYTGALRLTAPR